MALASSLTARIQAQADAVNPFRPGVGREVLPDGGWRAIAATYEVATNPVGKPPGAIRRHRAVGESAGGVDGTGSVPTGVPVIGVRLDAGAVLGALPRGGPLRPVGASAKDASPPRPTRGHAWAPWRSATAEAHGVASRPAQGGVGETPPMEEWALAVVAGIVLSYIALQTWRPWVVAPAIAFTAAGLLVGTEGLNWVDVSPDAGSLKLLAEATLALVLFSDASRIDLRALRDGYGLPARLLGIGLPLTIGAGTGAAIVVLSDLSVAEAAVLAIVLAATDAALGQAVVTDERLPAPIRQGLNVESGLNDGLCVPALVIALTLADTSSDALSGSEAARVIAESIGYGVLMGAVAGLVAALVQRRATAGGDEEQATWRFLLTLTAAALAYGLA